MTFLNIFCFFYFLESFRNILGHVWNIFGSFWELFVIYFTGKFSSQRVIHFISIRCHWLVQNVLSWVWFSYTFSNIEMMLGHYEIFQNKLKGGMEQFNFIWGAVFPWTCIMSDSYRKKIFEKLNWLNISAFDNPQPKTILIQAKFNFIT